MTAKQTKKLGLFTLIMLFLCTVILSCAFIAPKNTASAKAPVAGTDEIIGELAINANGSADTNGKVFSGNNLTALYDAILGNGYAGKGTLKNVEKLLDIKGTAKVGSGVTSKALNATDFRSIGGKDIYVTLGGIEWEVVYLTTNRSGELILDLWQATTTQTSPYSGSSSYNANGSAKGFTASSAIGLASLSMLYTNSYIRTTALGNGGKMYLWNSVEQNALSNPVYTNVSAGNNTYGYAKFATGNFESYLDAPADLEYQEKQSKAEIGVGISGGPSGYNLPNDAYGTPAVENYYTLNGFNAGYGGNGTNLKAGYGDWKTDKIWIPSLTETGDAPDGGIWGLSNNQRVNFTSSDTAAPTWDGVYPAYYWLRSGSTYYAHAARYMTSAGTGGSISTSSALAVRPAIHLNLTKAQADSNITKVPEPQNVTVDYDGSSKWLDSLETIKDGNNYKFKWIDTDLHNDPSIVTVKKIEYTGKDIEVADTAKSTVTKADVKNAGKYEVTLEIPSTSTNYVWNGGGTGEKKFTITVNQKAVPYTLQLNGGSTTSFAYSPTLSLTAGVSPTITLDSALPTNIYELWYKGADSTVYAESKTAPTGAGSYQLTLKPAPDTANAGKNLPSNYKLTGSVLNFTITKAEVNLPSFSGDLTYNANSQDFTLSDYDTSILKIAGITAGTATLTANAAGTQYADTDNYFVVDYDATNKKLSATNSATYTVTFDLVDSNNYTWASALSSSPKSKTFTIEKKELVIQYLSPLSNTSNFNLKTSTTGDITAQYTTGAATPSGGSVEEPMLNLYYVFTDGTNTGGKTQVGTAAAKIEDITLDVTTLQGNGGKFGVGTYTLTFELAPDTAEAVNKNYKLGTSATQAVTVTAGEASIDDIEIVYNTVAGENNGDPDAAIPSGGLTYEYDKTSGATEYKIYLDFSNIDYLGYETDENVSVSYDYGDGTHTVNKAGKVTVTVVIKSTDANYSLPATFDVTATNKFKSYQNNGNGTATLTFEVEIGKATADVKGEEIPLMYQREGSSDVVKYDPKKPPEYNGKPMTITLGSSALFPDYVKSVAFDDAVIKQTTAGDYKIAATVTLTDNYQTATGGSTIRVEIPWTIAKEQIDLTWTNMVYADDYFNDSSLAHLQMPLLSLTAAQDGNVEYEFYKEVGGAPDTVPMTEAEMKALCTNDRFTETTPTYIYVKAVLTENGAKKYQLEDDASKNPRRFRLGGNMTQINLTVSDAINGFVYGGELDVTTLFTLVNNETGDVWESSYYDIKVRKDGEDLCALADFKAGECDAGAYTFVIDIKDEYADSYVLDKSNKVEFVINPKEIALPTVGAMQFDGTTQNIASKLGGSYEQYKDIIKLSETVEQRNVGTYTTVLTITDPNYKWAESKEAVKLTLTDGEITRTDDAVAQCSWTIAPIVVNTSNLWNKGKDGATLKLPDNIRAFADAGTLEVGYRYKDAAGNLVETPELKGGKSFRVEAVFSGTDAELGNIVFEKSNGEFATVSDGIDYTVPQSGAAAFFGNALSFVKSHWLWFVIALAVLLFLIILICIIKHRKKTKEIREEKKAKKEEEKRRREEEREERKRKQEAELELQKAKQEAELAKMRAGLGLGAGAAGMAMAAQQQPVQQTMPQQMPMQPQMMPQYQQPQYPQQMPMPMPMQQMPQYSEERMRALEERLSREAEERARRADERALRAAEDRARIAEERAMRAEMNTRQYTQFVPQTGDGAQGSIPMDVLGALVVSALKNMAHGTPKLDEPKAELPQSVEESAATSVNTPTVYPPDAVITTTTTVDTTKAKSEPVSRDSDRSFDIDGFYDTFDVNNK